MSQSHGSSTHGSRRSSNSERNRVTDVDRTRRSRRRANHQQNDNQHSFREYIPNGSQLYNKLHEIEVNTINSAGSMSAFVSTYTLTCRVYYAYLFHIRLIQARIDAGISHSYERELLDHINNEVNIDTLPIHEDLVHVFRLAFPAVGRNQYSNGLAPAEPMYPVFEFKKRSKGPRAINCTWLNPSFIAQPSIRVGFHYLRWLNRNKDSSNDDSLPSITDRLNFMIFGESEDARSATSNDESILQQTLQGLFSNPMFLRHIPNAPGMTTSRLLHIDERTIPPNIQPLPSSATRAEVTENELLLNSDLDWLNHVKYIVSTLCHITDQLTHFRVLNEPYGLTELAQAMTNLEDIAHHGPNNEYVDARTWMTIYNDNVDFFTQQLRLEDSPQLDTPE